MENIREKLPSHGLLVINLHVNKFNLFFFLKRTVSFLFVFIWTISKVFIEFVTILLLFYILVF